MIASAFAEFNRLPRENMRLAARAAASPPVATGAPLAPPRSTTAGARR
jgi:hypothetical protein